MCTRSFSTVWAKAALLFAISSVPSVGAIIYQTGSLALTSASPLQEGRLSRSGVPSDWSAQKAFPGTLNPTTGYHYMVFSIPVSPFPYLQISFFDESGDTSLFASAYLDSYTPSTVGPNNGLNVNYLGDEGSSGTFAGNPIAFQVTLPNPTVDHLVLVVNDSSVSGAGVGEPFDFLVEGFYDTSFNDTLVAPEPGSPVLCCTGLLLAGIAGWRQRKRLS